MSSDTSRIIPLAGVRNLRDLGGYTAAGGSSIRWGQVYRSGHLSDMTEACGEDLAGRGILSVIDFRSEGEKERSPVRWTEAWTPTYIPLAIGGNAAAWVKKMFDEIGGQVASAADIHDQFLAAYRTIPIRNADGLARFFRALIDAPKDGTALFHCASGKDRTGIAAALLLELLGVDRDTVMEDFLLTNPTVDADAMAERLAGWLSERSGSTVSPQAVMPMVGVEDVFLAETYKAIDAEFGNMARYRKEALGLSTADEEILKARLLD